MSSAAGIVIFVVVRFTTLATHATSSTIQFISYHVSDNWKVYISRYVKREKQCLLGYVPDLKPCGQGK